jgi:hypothetical protein
LKRETGERLGELIQWPSRVWRNESSAGISKDQVLVPVSVPPIQVSGNEKKGFWSGPGVRARRGFPQNIIPEQIAMSLFF